MASLKNLSFLSQFFVPKGSFFPFLPNTFKTFLPILSDDVSPLGGTVRRFIPRQGAWLGTGVRKLWSVCIVTGRSLGSTCPLNSKWVIIGRRCSFNIYCSPEVMESWALGNSAYQVEHCTRSLGTTSSMWQWHQPIPSVLNPLSYQEMLHTWLAWVLLLFPSLKCPETNETHQKVGLGRQ